MIAMCNYMCSNCTNLSYYRRYKRNQKRCCGFAIGILFMLFSAISFMCVFDADREIKVIAITKKTHSDTSVIDTTYILK